MICVLHTFGRDLKWNPHIHMILSEEAVGNSGIWKKFNHINYAGLRRSWQYCLLKLMLENISTPEFKALVDRLYIDYKDGFYVNAPPLKHFSAGVVHYIVRYTGRPVIAQSRISDYDGDSVTFSYTPHGEDALVTETVSAFDFIKKLIIHIPDKHFKMIRYYGVYSVKSSTQSHYSKRLKRVNPAMAKNLKAAYGSWRKRIQLSFRFDPIKCHCGAYLELIDIFKDARAVAFILSFLPDTS
jgi:hypothetical protein